MAISLTQVELSSAIRLGDSAPRKSPRPRGCSTYTTAAISRNTLATSYEAAPEVIVNEAAIRLAGYLFDQPNAGRGLVICKRWAKFGRLGDPSTFQGSPCRIDWRRCSSGTGGPGDRQ